MDYFDGDKILEQIEQDSFQKAVISGKKDKAIYIFCMGWFSITRCALQKYFALYRVAKKNLRSKHNFFNGTSHIL